MAASTAAAGLLLLLSLIAGARPQDADQTPLCQRPGCNCVQSAATCDFSPDQVVRLGAGALPAGSSVSVVSASGARELHVLAGALSGVRVLHRLRLRHIGKVVLRKGALDANAEPHAILEVSDCGVLVLESGACRGLRGDLIALVARCGHVLLQAGAFLRLLALTIAHVPHLQMQEKALDLDISAGRATVVNLTHVLMPELAPHTFPTSVVEVRLQDCEVVAVRGEAFSALLVDKLTLVNSSLHDVAAAAFSSRTLFDQLLISGSRVHRLRRGAFLAGVSNLTIERSRIDEVESGAVNNSVAAVTLQHNEVGVVRRQGFVLRKWSRLKIVNNTFQQLEEDSIWAPYRTVAGAPVSELRFSENRLGIVAAGGLRWLGVAAAGVGSATAAGNVLEGTPCRCDLLGGGVGSAQHAAAGAAAGRGGGGRGAGVRRRVAAAQAAAAARLPGGAAVQRAARRLRRNGRGGCWGGGGGRAAGGRRLAGPRVRRAAAAAARARRRRRRAARRRGQVDADAARGAHAGAAADAARQARRPRQLQRGARHDRAPLRPHQGRGERRRGARDGRGDPAVGARRDAQHGHAGAVPSRGRRRAGARVRRLPGAARPLALAAPVRRAAARRGRARRRRALRVRRAARQPPPRRPARLLRAARQHGGAPAALHALHPLTGRPTHHSAPPRELLIWSPVAGRYNSIQTSFTVATGIRRANLTHRRSQNLALAGDVTIVPAAPPRHYSSVQTGVATCCWTARCEAPFQALLSATRLARLL